MTPIRGLALKISNTVVRYASPGCKEWAEGLAREVAFVEGDWAALVWALGSVRVLFDYREAPIASLADVPNAALKFVELMGNSFLGLLTVIVSSPFYVWKFFYAKNWLERAGCALVVFCSIAAGIFWLIERRRLKEPSNDIYDNIVACALYYKTELERRCSTLPIHISIVFGWLIGTMLDARGGLYFHAVFSAIIVLLGLATAPLILSSQRTIRKRLERLNALLAETPMDR